MLWSHLGRAASSLSFVAVAVALTGCAASARFYSKNGQTYPALTPRAVSLDEREVPLVTQAGGQAIGTISAHALSVQADDEDVAEKALKVAAKSGGTHVLRTEKGIESFTVTTPGQAQQDCVQTDQGMSCRTIVTAPTSTTYDKPTAKFVVFRVPAENWARLPAQLRPRGE